MNAVTQAMGCACDSSGWGSYREQLAWAAGFFDGEGTTSVSTDKNGNRKLTVCADQNDPRVLERFAHALGHIGRMYGPYRDRSGRFIHWRYTAGKWEYGQAWLAMMWPFLSPVKRAQAVRGLNHSRGRRGPRQEYCVRGHWFPPDCIRDANGRRVCVQCRRIRNRAWYHRDKAVRLAG